MMLELASVSLRYPNGHHAIEGINLSVPARCIVVMIGVSGCGKSTLLRLVAGLEQPTSGTVSVAGEIVDRPTRHVGFVFQEPRLMPWLTVSENVTFGLADRPRKERDAVAARVLDRIGFADFGRALPKQLSGGMAQRVALARALVGDPEVLLLDEPFNALDALTRSDLQQHLLDLWAVDHRTMLLATHDIDEALGLADTIVVLAGQPGRIVDQVDIDDPRPRDLTSERLASIRRWVIAGLSVTPKT